VQFVVSRQHACKAIAGAGRGKQLIRSDQTAQQLCRAALQDCFAGQRKHQYSCLLRGADATTPAGEAEGLELQCRRVAETSPAAAPVPLTPMCGICWLSAPSQSAHPPTDASAAPRLHCCCHCCHCCCCWTCCQTCKHTRQQSSRHICYGRCYLHGYRSTAAPVPLLIGPTCCYEPFSMRDGNAGHPTGYASPIECNHTSAYRHARHPQACSTSLQQAIIARAPAAAAHSS
jgi:hypothetical protein